MGTDWTNKIPVKILRIAFVILLVLLIVIIIVGLTTNKAIEVWVIKFNTKETVFRKDTTYLIRYDTILLNNYPVSSGKRNTPSGSKFSLENPTFNAPTQVGDNNTQNITPKLPQRIIDNNFINFLIGSNPRRYNYTIRYYSNPETNIVFSELKKGLENKGFQVKFWAVMNLPVGTKIQKEIEVASAPSSDSTIWVVIYPQE